MVRQTLLVLALVAPAAHAVVLRGQTVDAERMRPEVVAKTLAKVEDDWKAQAIAFTTDSTAAGQGAPASFEKSCATVVTAVVQGSDGDRSVAKEYMDNVCGQQALMGWHKLRCNDLAGAIVDHAMTANDYANRETFNPTKLCTGFWTKFVDEERKREAEEAKERIEREKKEAEEAAKAKVKAEAEAKIEAERRAKEEAEREQKEKEEKAKREASEAKVRAADAAAKLVAKKAEAEAVQKAAKEKLAEADKAEKEHLRLQAEHQKAEENLRNAKVEQSTAKAAPKDSAPLVAKSAPAANAQPVTEVVANLEPVKADAVKAVAVVVAKPAVKEVVKAEPVAVAKAEPVLQKTEKQVESKAIPVKVEKE